MRQFFELAHLWNRDLAQGSIGREGYEIRMRGKQERVFVALLRCPFFALVDDGLIVAKAEVILLNLMGFSEQSSGKSPGQSGLPQPLRSREEEGLREAFLARKLLQSLGDRLVAVKIGEHHLT